MWNNYLVTVESNSLIFTIKRALSVYKSGIKLLFLLVFQLLLTGVSFSQNILDKVGELEATEGFSPIISMKMRINFG